MITDELTLNPRELARAIGEMMERARDNTADLHTLGHCYAVISMLADITPTCYPTNWTDHMNSVIDLNRLTRLLIDTNKAQQVRILAQQRRIDELRAEVNRVNYERNALHNALLRNSRPVQMTTEVPS